MYVCTVYSNYNVYVCFEYYVHPSLVPVLKDMNADPSTELMNMMSGSSVSGSSATAYPLGSHQSVCPSIVLYVVITKDIVNKELIQVLDTLDKIMNDECLPYELRKLMFLQVHDYLLVYACVQ